MGLTSAATDALMDMVVGLTNHAVLSSAGATVFRRLDTEDNDGCQEGDSPALDIIHFQDTMGALSTGRSKMKGIRLALKIHVHDPNLPNTAASKAKKVYLEDLTDALVLFLINSLQADRADSLWWDIEFPEHPRPLTEYVKRGNVRWSSTILTLKVTQQYNPVP